MRIKLDENLPESLLVSLASLGHDVDNNELYGLAPKEIKIVGSASK